MVSLVAHLAALPCPYIHSKRPGLIPDVFMSYTFKLHKHSHNMNQFCLGMSPSSCSDLRLHTFFSKSILCCSRDNKNWKSKTECTKGLFPGFMQFQLVDTPCNNLNINLTEFFAWEYVTGIRFSWLEKNQTLWSIKNLLTVRAMLTQYLGKYSNNMRDNKRRWHNFCNNLAFMYFL